MTLIATVRRTRDWRFQEPGPICNNLPLELFVPDEELECVPPEVRRICEVCPVKPECLAEALEKSWEGYWGGTSTEQRTKMKRKINRARCVGCSGTDSLVTEGNRQLCLACGVSWYIY